MTGESLRALALIFIKPLIMAGKYSDKHVFPLFLDADAKSVASGNIPVDTSFVKLNPGSADVAFTLPDGTIAGQVITVMNISAGNDVNIAVTTPLDASFSDVDLEENDDLASFIWNGSAWIIFAGGGAAAIA